MLKPFHSKRENVFVFYTIIHVDNKETEALNELQGLDEYRKYENDRVPDGLGKIYIKKMAEFRVRLINFFIVGTVDSSPVPQTPEDTIT